MIPSTLLRESQSGLEHHVEDTLTGQLSARPVEGGSHTVLDMAFAGDEDSIEDRPAFGGKWGNTSQSALPTTSLPPRSLAAETLTKS